MRALAPLVGSLALLLIYDGLTGSAQRKPLVVTERLQRLIDESGSRGLTPVRLIASSGLLALVALMVVAGMTSSLVVGIAFALFASWIPFARCRSRRRRRLRNFQQAWPDAISTLIASIRAGVSLPEACVSLLHRGPPELQRGFDAFASSYRASGDLTASLDRLRLEMADPIADRVCAAMQLAHQVGGTDLVRVLRTVGDFVRDDLRTKKEIEARWSWTVTAARVAAAAPWAVLLIMGTRPEAAAAYSTPTGAMVIAVGGLATLLGYRLMLRAARLPEETRLG